MLKVDIHWPPCFGRDLETYEVLPCPFCAQYNLVFELIGGDWLRLQCETKDCYASGPERMLKGEAMTDDDAISAVLRWNLRITRDSCE